MRSADSSTHFKDYDTVNAIKYITQGFPGPLFYIILLISTFRCFRGTLSRQALFRLFIGTSKWLLIFGQRCNGRGKLSFPLARIDYFSNMTRPPAVMNVCARKPQTNNCELSLSCFIQNVKLDFWLLHPRRILNAKD